MVGTKAPNLPSSAVLVSATTDSCGSGSTK
jgi:hypothetical protein